MRLLSRPNRRIGDKVYRTWYISLHIETVDELGGPGAKNWLSRLTEIP